MHATNMVTSKDRLVDRKDPYAHFTGQSLTISLAKASIIRAALDLAAEEHARLRWPSTVSGKAKTAAREVLPAFAKDVAIVSLQRGLEHVAVRELSEKRAGQLMRDATLVAKRKYEKNNRSRFAAAKSVLPSTFRGSLLPNSAIFLVESAYAVVIRLPEWWARLTAKRSAKRSAKHSAKRSAKRSSASGDGAPADELPMVKQHSSLPGELLDLLARCLGTVVFEAAGASIGTLVLPGTGTLIGHILGGLVCWLV